MEKILQALLDRTLRELSLLEEWQQGQKLDSLPAGWDVDKQLYFVKGMVEAINIVKANV